MEDGQEKPYQWEHAGSLPALRWRCGHCGSIVSTSTGYREVQHSLGVIYPCTHCGKPTYMQGKVLYPGEPHGDNIEHLPDDVDKLYAEVRKCVSAGAYTAAVLACRKILMHAAVAKGAKAGKGFLEYVEHLATGHYIPPGAVGWIGHIRTKANELNHQINLAEKSDAERLVDFTAMLLKVIYEYPAKAPKAEGDATPEQPQQAQA